MEKIKEVIVVEGKDDTRRLIEVFGDIDTIETVGSALEKETIEQIRLAEEKRGVIVFTDPDFPGEQIRKKIIAEIPTVKHAFLTKKEGKGKKAHESLGVEHASDEAIIHALKKVYSPQKDQTVAISREVLFELGLISGPNAKKHRQFLGESLKIGYTNGKQLQKRLQMFGITEEEIIKHLQQMKEAENV